MILYINEAVSISPASPAPGIVKLVLTPSKKISNVVAVGMGVASTAEISTFPPTDGFGTVSAIDNVTLANDNRVLIKNQGDTSGDAKDNGLYLVKSSGTWVRAADMFSGSAENFAVFVEEGDDNVGTSYTVMETFPYFIF